MGQIRADVTTSSGHLLEFVRTGRARTRGELQELTGLSRSTVGLRLDGLVRRSWLCEAGSTTSTGGRPPVVLQFDESHAVVLTADLDTRHARAAVMDLGGRVLQETSGELVVSAGPVPVLDTLATWFKSLLEQAGRGLVKVSTGIGAGVVIGNEVFRGIDGGAGDVGHIRVRDAGDAKCQCGSLGCLAAVASGGAVVLYQLTLPRATRHLKVVPARLADHAALQGMARLVVDEVYSPAAVDARLS